MCTICNFFVEQPQPEGDCTFETMTGGVSGSGGTSGPVVMGITVTESGDASANTSTTATMAVGDFYHGEISGGSDTSDWIAVTLTAGQEYTIAIAGTGALDENLRDTYLRIRDAAGVEIQFNDDIDTGSGYYYSTVTFTAPSTGTYYIDVQSWNNSFTGSYGVSVVEGGIASYDALMGAGMLLSPNASWASAAGTGTNVTWAIRESGSDPANGSTMVAPSAAQIAAITEIMGYVEGFTGLTFTQVNSGGTSNNATMLFGAYDVSDGRGAYAFYPDSWGGNSPDTDPALNAGDVWLNNTSVSTTSLPFGTFSHFALMHEIGHALGLAHPGPYNAGGGGTITYASNAEFIQDSHQYTIMSYFDESNTGASSLGFADTFMLFDYLALHQLYGANTGFHSEDTVYGFNATHTGTAYDFTANTDPLMCIYDGNGIDTFDLSGYAMGQVLSLVEGTFSNIGGYNQNVSIAYGAVIENAIGGSGADTITGNSAANDIRGGAGNDTILGAGGNDSLDGGADNDTLNGGAGEDLFVFSGGQDVIQDFSGDLVQIERSLWSGTVDSLLAGAVVSNGNLVLNLGGGNTLTLNGVTSTSALSGRIRIGEADPEQDFSGDGVSGTIWRNSTTGQVGLYELEGANIVWRTLASSTGAEWYIAGSGDFDGDGVDDILWRNSNTGQVGMYEMGSGSPVWRTIVNSSGAEWDIVGIGDFDGDGTDDILWRSNTTYNLGMFEMSGGNETWRSLGGTNGVWDVVGTGDYNGDGTDDILWRNTTTGQLGMYEMTGGVSSWRSLGSTDPTWRLVGSGDFDGDGTDDILWRNPNSGELGMFAMGSGSPVWQRIASTSLAWDMVGIGDYNGDGTDDILWRNVNTGAMGMFEMDDGNETWRSLGSTNLGWDIEGQFVDEFVF